MGEGVTPHADHNHELKGPTPMSDIYPTCAICTEELATTDSVSYGGTGTVHTRCNTAARGTTTDAVLAEASDIVTGARRDDYGTVDESFARIAKMWTAILDHPIAPEQVALCMAALKMGRLCYTPGHHDSWVDSLGYIALGAQLASKGPVS